MEREIRIKQIVVNASTPERRRRDNTFFTSGDPETQRRADLPVLIPFSSYLRDPLYGVRADQEGRIYIPRWSEAGHINEGDVIFGRVQIGRDYAKNPPKTKGLRRLNFDYIPAGVDVALRRTETIRDKYRGDNKEVRQIVKGLELVAKLRQQTRNLPEVTEEDLTEYGLENPRLAGKKNVRKMLLRGSKDKTGKTNPLAVFSRMFSVEVNLRKRMENAFPNILTKYANNTEMLRFERDRTRWVFRELIDELQKIAENPQSKDIYQNLSLVSKGLFQVRVRPYLLGAYTAVSQIGMHYLPKETVMKMIQERRRAEGVLSVRDLLKEGNFAGAQEKLKFITHFLQRILDLHVDYHTVKASEKRRKRLEKAVTNSPE